jgi:hypothetical protein
MLQSTRSRVTALVATGCLAAGIAGTASGAPTQQEGLVNVNVTDLNVQVPVAVAANICDVNANVLAEQADLGTATCTATADSIATNGPRSGQGGPVQQDGLVNVNITDVSVQAPITVAANVCDVDVNVLARQLGVGDANCTATPTSLATN